jgi:hypothetical protein
MVALADWRITLNSLKLEELSSPSRIDPEGLLSIGCAACSIGGQVCVITFVALFVWGSLVQSYVRNSLN